MQNKGKEKKKSDPKNYERRPICKEVILVIAY